MAKVMLHIINIETGILIKQRTTEHTPRIGEELRISDREVYFVEQVVRCYDEPKIPFERVNIGVSVVTTTEQIDFDDPCPQCGEQLQDGVGGGAVCANCGYWVCF